MAAVLYPTTNFNHPEQLCLHKGRGVFVQDDKGRNYLEGMSGLWCTSLGYGNEELVETANQQMKELSYSHLFGGKTHPKAQQLADKIANMVPMENAKVFFGSSGSDANDTQLKLLQYHNNALGRPNKKRIICRERAYHGVGISVSALTGLPTTHAGFDVPFDSLGVIRTKAPHYYREHLPGETEPEFTDRLIQLIEQQIHEAGAENIAAMIIEPVTGAGGVVVPPADYLSRLSDLLRKHDILLWDDEVICGFGRTGNDFGATTYDFQPDMMSFAKGLSSGYLPISAAVISGDMYEVIEAAGKAAGMFGHGYTYSGHPVCCAVALKALEIYERDNIFERARRTGEYLQRKLAAFNQHDLVGEVRGVGMLHAIELVADKTTGEPFKDGTIGLYAQERCQDNGLILRAVAGSSLAICPPLVISESEVDLLIERLGCALDQTLSHVQSSH